MNYLLPCRPQSVALLTLLGALAAWMVSALAEPTAGKTDPSSDYAKHLLETKGIADIRTLHKSVLGPNGLDVVVVSAGFTAAEKDHFLELGVKMKDAFFSMPPWDRYSEWVNFHTVFVADESMEKTRLNVAGYKGQLLVSDNGIATEYASYAADADGVVVLHNSDFSTATCGTWGVATINKTSANNAGALVHELGHGISGLGDEYIQREGPFNEPPENLRDTVNVTPEANPRLCKWHYWTVDEWPGIIRTLKGTGSIVANFEGAGWPSKIYRPEKSCIMRGDRNDFCVVCNEAMEGAFFRHSALFGSVDPALAEHVLWKGESLDFRVKTNDLIVRPPKWISSRLELFIEGQSVASSDSGEVSFHFDGAKAKPGVYQLGAQLDVQCDTIRRDFGFLSETRAWRVKVMPHPKPRLTVESKVTIPASGTVNIPVTLQQSGPARFELRMEHAPPNAVLEGGAFKWNPNGKIGSWRIDFIASLAGEDAVTKSLEIHVGGSGKSNSDAAIVVDAIAEKEVVIKLGGENNSEQNQLFEMAELPAGAVLNRHTGELKWTPEPQMIGLRVIPFRVSSGTDVREMDLVCRIRGAAEPTPVSYANQYIPQTLAALNELQQNPLVYQRMFETLRLLRDRYSRIWEPALAEAEKMFGELDAKYQNQCIEYLTLHAWAFTDKPEILAWMTRITGDVKTEASRKLAGTLSLITTVEKIKEIELQGGPSDLKRTATSLIQSTNPVIRAAFERAVAAICKRIDDKAGCQRVILSVLANEKGPGRATLARLMPLDRTPELMNGLTALARDQDRDVATVAQQTSDYFTGLATTGDFITHWMLAGPYPAREGGSLFDDEFEPELKDSTVEWKPFELKDAKDGNHIVHLDSLYGGINRAAYMMTIIHSDSEQEALFAAGSDDGIKVWLNGELIHAKNAQRAVNPGEDRFIGKLNKGSNQLLCKIIQYQSGWGACMQIHSADGGPALGVKVNRISNK